MRLEVNLKVTDWEEDVELGDVQPRQYFDCNTPLTLETGAEELVVLAEGVGDSDA